MTEIDRERIANAIYVGMVNPDLTWWDDLTPEMKGIYLTAAEAVYREIRELWDAADRLVHAPHASSYMIAFDDLKAAVERLRKR